MSNRIQSITLRDHSLIPAEAIVHVTVHPERLDTGTEVRGRLMGPRCHFASTVEVAYHLRPVLVPTSQPALTLRAVIPEASFWTPKTPHLYTGPVELWQDGHHSEVVQLRHGLRHVTVGPRGLRVNGQALRLRGRQVQSLDDATALSLRDNGYDLVLAAVEEATRAIWDIADRIGLFVLGRMEGESALSRELATHPSCLGWVQGETGVIQGEGPGHIAGRFALTSAHPGAVNGARKQLLLGTSPDEEGAGSIGVVEV